MISGPKDPKPATLTIKPRPGIVRVRDSRVRLLYFRNANLEGMISELVDVDWEKLLRGQSASEKWEISERNIPNPSQCIVPSEDPKWNM